MVAFSFKARFVVPIVAGTKGGTIRRPRKRDPRPGEELQLYTGMRTKKCLLIAREQCVAVEAITLDFLEHRFEVGGRILTRHQDLTRFALFDGFQSLEDMIDFWRPKRGGTNAWHVFFGVHVRWLEIDGRL